MAKFESWRGTEAGAWSFEWDQTGNNGPVKVYNVKQEKGAEALTGKLELIETDTGIAAKKTNTEDGNDSLYWGEFTDDTKVLVKGSYLTEKTLLWQPFECSRAVSGT